MTSRISGRRIPWGGLYFRPEKLGMLNGIDELDPAGTDFAMRFVRSTWKYHKISSVQIAEDLERLPGMIDEIDGMAERGLIDGENPTAADFQIGSSIWVIATISDAKPVIEGSAAERVAERYFGEIPGTGSGRRLPGQLDQAPGLRFGQQQLEVAVSARTETAFGHGQVEHPHPAEAARRIRAPRAGRSPR